MKTIHFQHTYDMRMYDVLNTPISMIWLTNLICAINIILFWEITSKRNDLFLKRVFAAIVGYLIWSSGI